MRKFILFLVSYIIYLMLTWVPNIAEILVGLPIALGIALIFSEIFTISPQKLFQVKRYLYFLYYVPVFLYYCIKANIDVAYRVIHPKMPIKPGIVKIKTNLKSDTALTMLANSITLTPRTLTVDIKDGYMYVHWIDVKTKEVERATELIAQRFEKLIKEIFE